MPLFIDGFQLDASDMNMFQVKESAKRLLQTFIDLDSKKQLFTDENVAEIAKILDESNSQLVNIVRKIDGTKQQIQ
jgi:hypothetical protein